MCLIARHLEAKGIPTLCLGSALDIMTAGAPPRAAFVDYPLGHSAGKPFDADDQLRVVRATLDTFATLAKGDPIARLDGTWDADSDWRSKAIGASGGDVRMPRDTSPQYQTEDDRRLAEGR